MLPRLNWHPVPAGLLLAAGTLLQGCASLGPAAFATWQIEGRPDGATVMFQGIPVRTGQIVASEQGTPQSIFLALLVADNYPFMHTGIIAIEDGRPVVYEANGQVQPYLGGGPPTRHIGGGVRREPLGYFLGRQSYIAIYDPPAGVDGDRIAKFAEDSLRQGLAFDPYFNGDDPSKVYCSEFTALALAAGGAGPARTSDVNPNASVAIVLNWLGITTRHFIPVGALIANATRVGLFSRRHSPAQIEAYFAVKAELHRRFTPDQKLGNVLRFSGLTGFRFQPEIQAFMQAVDEAAAGWGDLAPEAVDRRVRDLAVEQLGPFDSLPLADAADSRQRQHVAGTHQ